MSKSTQEQLRFPPVDGLTVRGEFDGGALSSDFGPMILRGVDRQIGLTERLAEAFDDKRHPSYITHHPQALFAQRIYQVACAYEDGNDANALRGDPVFKLGLERRPLDADTDLASGSTFSRLENAACAKDIFRLAQAFVDQFIASYPMVPQLIVLDMDHSEDATYGQQELSFYNHHYRSYCYLPLFLFEGISGKFITAALRPGKRPKGAENAMILKRVLKRLRAAWPSISIWGQTMIKLTKSKIVVCPRIFRDEAGLDSLYELWDENTAMSSNKAYMARAREHGATLKDMMEADRLQLHDRSERGWTPPPKDYSEKLEA